MNQDEQELIRRAQQRDAAAFEHLIRRYDKRVLRMAFVYSGNRNDAQDIYQEVFLRVYTSLPSFRFASAFATWLFRITTNVCLTFVRRHGAAPLVRLEDNVNAEQLNKAADSGFQADRNAHSDDVYRMVREAMSELSPQQKLVCTLKYFEHCTISEVADILDCSTGSVKRHLFDGTRRMRRRLQHLRME